jgi:hypothetical protein
LAVSVVPAALAGPDDRAVLAVLAASVELDGLAGSAGRAASAAQVVPAA